MMAATPRHHLAKIFVLLNCIFLCGCERDGKVVVVADFGDRQATGVAVSHDGRVFVCFPRWSLGHDVSVAEVLDNGTIRPYPNEHLNQWQADDSPKDRFVCTQSLYIDTNDPAASLWVLDAGNVRFEGVLPGAAKLVRLDLKTNRLARVIRFDSTIVLPQSYLNDVRVDAQRGFAYITDSGVGAIVVVDLNTGRSRRVLAEHAATQAEAGIWPVIDGKPWRLPDGGVPQIHADGIAISNDKEQLYIKPLTGRNLYRVAAAKLRNFSIPDSALDKSPVQLGSVPIGGGMFMSPSGNLYIAAVETNAIVRRKPSGQLETILASNSLSWPNSLAMSQEGDLYITAPQIHLNAAFSKGPSQRTEPYRLYKVPGVEPKEENPIIPAK